MKEALRQQALQPVSYTHLGIMARNKYDVDETLETKFDMKQIKRLFSYVGRYRKKLIMTIMLMLFSSALGMVIPVLMQRVMDIYIPNHDKKGILLMAARCV